MGLPQRLLDSGRRHLRHLNGNLAVESHAQCLSSAALLASDRLACQAAMPLLAHALQFGVNSQGSGHVAQVDTLSFLVRLVKVPSRPSRQEASMIRLPPQEGVHNARSLPETT